MGTNSMKLLILAHHCNNIHIDKCKHKCTVANSVHKLDTLGQTTS